MARTKQDTFETRVAKLEVAVDELQHPLITLAPERKYEIPALEERDLLNLNPDMDFDWTWLQQMLALRALRNNNEIVYDYNMRGIPMVSVEEFVKAFAALGGRVVSENLHGDLTEPQEPAEVSPEDDVDPPEDRDWKRQRHVWSDGVLNLYVSKDSAEINIYSLDKARVEKCIEIVGETITESIVSNGKAYVLVQTPQGIEFESIGIAAIGFEGGNYNEEVVEGYDHIVKDLKDSKPCGRISVFDGPPGTGKTYLVRALLNDVKEALFVLVAPELVPALAQPGMVQAILRRRYGRKGPTIFVVEDADSVLAKRGADNMSGVSAILNLSDGLLGNMLDLRIVATTNAERKEIDEAVMRDGRLCRRIEIGALNYERAAAALKRLGGDVKLLEKGKDYSLAQIYRLSRGDRTDGAAKEIKRRGVMGFGQ